MTKGPDVISTHDQVKSNIHMAPSCENIGPRVETKDGAIFWGERVCSRLSRFMKASFF